MILRRAQSAFFNERGFSLAEVLTAVGVFSILAMIGIPNYRAAQPGFRLNGSARIVLSKLMWARSQAVEENSTYVAIFPTNHSLKIFNDTNANGFADLLEWTETIDLRTNYPDVQLTTSGNDPTFNGRGTAGGNTTITLINSSGSKIVTVNRTGNIRIN
jgi:prepilin-type N-terminal cleavage/methylation domain-containing protein